jgi:rare lipoprotein A
MPIIESMKKIMLVFVSLFVLSGLCFAQARIGEVNRGIFYQEGIASWYGREFNGKTTASGEIFNDAQLTAAHPILPFGTLLRVTNQHNNKTVTVRVNDRGPFTAERILDLSRSAAELLDMISTGTAPVIVESLHEVSLPVKPETPVLPSPAQPALTREQPPQNSQTILVQPGQTIHVQAASVEPFSAAESVPAQTQNRNQGQLQTEIYTGKNYKIQVGAYRQPEHAVEAFEKLKKAGLTPSYERFGDYYRVIVPGIKQEELRAVSDRLNVAGFKEVLVKEE